MRLPDFNGREIATIKLHDGTEFSASSPQRLIFLNGWVVLEMANREEARWNMVYLQYIEWAKDDDR